MPLPKLLAGHAGTYYLLSTTNITVSTSTYYHNTYLSRYVYITLHLHYYYSYNERMINWYLDSINGHIFSSPNSLLHLGSVSSVKYYLPGIDSIKSLHWSSPSSLSLRLRIGSQSHCFLFLFTLLVLAEKLKLIRCTCTHLIFIKLLSTREEISGGEGSLSSEVNIFLNHLFVCFLSCGVGLDLGSWCW